MKIVHAIMRGRVQGVGYRAFVEHEALKHGIEGWVRNRRDGSVELQAIGPADRLEALALACGINYGVAAFSIKLVTTEFGGGPARVFTNWPIYLLAVVGPVGFILNQNALQEGTFLAPAQAIITTTDPVISIALGVLWLGVALRTSPVDVFGQVASLLLMTAGIIITARVAPQATGSPPPGQPVNTGDDAGGG